MKILKIISNSSPLLFSNIVISLCTLINVPLMLKLYGVEKYGYFASFLVLVNLINTVLNIQPWQALIQYWYSLEDDNEKGKAATICIFLDFFSASIASIFYFCFGTYLVDALSLSIFSDQKLAIVVVLFIFSYQTSFVVSIFRIKGKYKIQALLDSMESICRLLLIAISFYVNSDIDIINLISLYFAIGVFFNAIRFVLAYLYSKSEIKITRFYLSDAIFKNFLTYSYWVYIKSLVDLPLTHLDRLLVIKILGPSSAALLDVLKKIVGLFSFVIRPISQVLLPELTQNVKIGNSRSAYKFSSKYSYILLLANVFVTTFCFIIANYFNLFSILGLKLISENIIFSYFYVLVSVLPISFIFIHILFMAEGMVKKDAKNLLLANIIYLIIVVMLLHYLQLWALVLSILTQSLLVITYKTKLLKEKHG